ncbi:MAG: U32 family peptidase [Bacteroidetes bacterium]|nr:U32 family peptidase [Bacteroidota bacterium]
MTKHDIEIMSPVGSYEALMAAIQGGANAVYFGVGQLNMRAKSSNNFSIEDLIEICRICKENNIKSYLTVNTIIYNHETDEMRTIVDAAKKYGVTAIIASDMAVIGYASSIGMEIHISTQCNITNIEAVKFYAKFADVMVTARELSLQQVADICRIIEDEQIKGPNGELIKIEVFAHGALCMAVSGKCYLSLDNLNSSANRGACLQVCRRPYHVTDKDGGIELEVDNEYIMSPKDLKTIDFLDKILKAGVRVLKIEGRGRSPEYVKTVTQCYREAADAYFDGTYTEENIALWTARLESVYNRGFWDGYYLGRKTGEWTKGHGSQATKRKVYVGKITNYFANLKVAEVKIETHSLQLGDEIHIIGPTTGVYEDKISEIRVELQAVNEAVKGISCSIPVNDVVRRQDKLYKIVDNLEDGEF